MRRTPVGLDEEKTVVNMAECDRESDVFEAAMSGYWPPGDEGDPVDDDLCSHITRCPVCADVADVAVVLRNERDAAVREARVPTSGQVWWRATMRTRAEATAAAARPIAMLQGLAGACAAGMCATLIAVAWPTGHPFAWMAATLSREGQRIAAAVASAAVMQQSLLSLAALLVAGLILSPLVLYLALSDE